MQSTRYFCKILVEFESSGQIFEKYLSIKFDQIPSSESRVDSCRQTDRHEEANSRFSQHC
jgi:hypothetical protein